MIQVWLPKTLPSALEKYLIRIFPNLALVFVFFESRPCNVRIDFIISNIGIGDENTNRLMNPKHSRSSTERSKCRWYNLHASWLPIWVTKLGPLVNTTTILSTEDDLDSDARKLDSSNPDPGQNHTKTIIDNRKSNRNIFVSSSLEYY